MPHLAAYVYILYCPSLVGVVIYLIVTTPHPSFFVEREGQDVGSITAGVTGGNADQLAFPGLQCRLFLPVVGITIIDMPDSLLLSGDMVLQPVYQFSGDAHFRPTGGGATPEIMGDEMWYLQPVLNRTFWRVWQVALDGDGQ